jgi:hypothetical protein
VTLQVFKSNLYMMNPKREILLGLSVKVLLHLSTEVLLHLSTHVDIKCGYGTWIWDMDKVFG